MPSEMENIVVSIPQPDPPSSTNETEEESDLTEVTTVADKILDDTTWLRSQHESLATTVSTNLTSLQSQNQELMTETSNLRTEVRSLSERIDRLPTIQSSASSIQPESVTVTTVTPEVIDPSAVEGPQDQRTEPATKPKPKRRFL